MASKSVAKTERPYQILQKELAAVAGNFDVFEIASGIIDKMMSAETPEEMFAAQNEDGPEDAFDYLGKPLGVYEVTFAKSSSQYEKGGLGFYAVFKATTVLGKEVLISVGAANVVTTLFFLVSKGHVGNGEKYWLTIDGRATGNGTLYTCNKYDQAAF